MRRNCDETANDEFIERFRNGEIEAFNEFCYKYRAMIERAIYRRCKLQDKDDVVQEVLLRAFNCRKEYDPSKAKITTWICNIANNLAIDIYRHNTRKLKGHSVVNVSKDPCCPAPREPSTVSIKFLSGISNGDAQILRMKYVDGMTSRAIAEHLGMQKSAVVSKIHQLKVKLRNIHGNDAKSSFID